MTDMNTFQYTNADLQLDLRHYDGEIPLKEYIERSPEYRETFCQFCQEYDLPADEKAAERFFDWLLEQEEEVHTDGLD